MSVEGWQVATCHERGYRDKATILNMLIEVKSALPSIEGRELSGIRGARFKS
jgi:hypothetical protein